jgi:predicted nucleotidyltransferase
MFPISLSILYTLTYADVFDYPLTLKEVFLYLITPQRPSQIKTLQKTLSKLSSVSRTGPYYYLKNRSFLVKIRRQRVLHSRAKLQIAKEIVAHLKRIPTIKAILITGALAMKNAQKDDDIDLAIICQKNSLWLTRPIIIIILELLKVRRKPHDRRVADKICSNLFLDESSLILPPKNRNLFTAHEILQAEPVFNRRDTYFKFIAKNSWAQKYLPHAYKSIINLPADEAGYQLARRRGRLSTYPPTRQVINLLLLPFNLLFYLFQFLYMSPRRTKEKISLHYAFFHPHSKKNKILKEYKKRIESLNL